MQINQKPWYYLQKWAIHTEKSLSIIKKVKRMKPISLTTNIFIANDAFLPILELPLG